MQKYTFNKILISYQEFWKVVRQCNKTINVATGEKFHVNKEDFKQYKKNFKKR